MEAVRRVVKIQVGFDVTAALSDTQLYNLARTFTGGAVRGRSFGDVRRSVRHSVGEIGLSDEDARHLFECMRTFEKKNVSRK